jgi:glutathione S-transferase
MILYTCRGQTHGATMPLIKHACGVAAKALDDAGHHYEVQVVGGFKNVPFSRRGKRDRIVELTGQEDVPVLVTDDGTVVSGSRRIAGWAQEHVVS